MRQPLPDYYWIREYPTDDWEVAYFDGKRWYRIGGEESLYDVDLLVGDKILPPRRLR